MEGIVNAIKKEMIIPVIKLDRIEDTIPLLDALRKAGGNAAEITFRTKAAESCLKLAAETYPDMLIGAGTVLNASQAERAVKAGAKFVVSPGYDAETSRYLKEKGILYIAGAVTPTEIMTLLNDGLNIVKFFPAENYGGIKTIKSLSMPFTDVVFIPTGGISANNIMDYLSFDKVIAAGGSWMVKDNLIKEGRFDEITRLMTEALTLVRK